MTPAPSAAAALAVCESLCLTLEEKGLLSPREVSDLLGDVVGAFEALARETDDPEAACRHAEAAVLVSRLRDGENALDLVAPPETRWR